MTLIEASRKYGYNPEVIRRWCRAGLVEARLVGKRLELDEASLQRHIADQHGARTVFLTASELAWAREHGPETLRRKLGAK